MDLRDALVDWDDSGDEGSNTAHVAEHGLTPDEVESALFGDTTTFDVSDSSGRPIAFGATATGRLVYLSPAGMLESSFPVAMSQKQMTSLAETSVLPLGRNVIQ